VRITSCVRTDGNVPARGSDPAHVLLGSDGVIGDNANVHSRYFSPIQAHCPTGLSYNARPIVLGCSRTQLELPENIFHATVDLP
jgi:hypothetical protein